MSKDRFLQLLPNLHFVDKENRNIDKKHSSVGRGVLPKLNFPINIQLTILDVRKDDFEHFPKWSEK